MRRGNAGGRKKRKKGFISQEEKNSSKGPSRVMLSSEIKRNCLCKEEQKGGRAL